MGIIKRLFNTVGVRSILRSAVVSTFAYFVVAVCVAVIVVVPATSVGVTWPVEVTVAYVVLELV